LMAIGTGNSVIGGKCCVEIELPAQFYSFQCNRIHRIMREVTEMRNVRKIIKRQAGGVHRSCVVGYVIRDYDIIVRTAPKGKNQETKGEQE